MMIKNFEPRLYQQTIFGTCAEQNTLVILPTGLGKTHIFLMLAAYRLEKYPGKKILFLGPTRPLISQYYRVFMNHFEIDKKQMVIFTGHVNPEKRAELWKERQIIFSTPQGMENDIISGRVNLEDVSLLGFDEAHRAVGNYSYVWIAKQYRQKAQKERIVGLTASPGSKLEKIEEVCKNLFIDAVEVRTDDDPDVKPYIHDVNVKWINLKLPDAFIEIRNFLIACNKSKINAIKKLDVLEIQGTNFSKRDLLDMQAKLRSEIIAGNKQYEILRGISLFAEVMKIQHALELLETQGIYALSEFLEGIVSQARTSKVKAVKNLAKDLNFRSALVKTRSLVSSKIEHPKMKELKSLVKEAVSKDKAIKIIIFSQYRDTITKITDELNKLGLKARMFVGQAKKKGTGLSQKEQISMLKEFKEGKFNIIAMSSVGEEGLDIPSVDKVIFYEPIPSAIRTIQRRGRTGRQEEGEVLVLVTKGTRDEAYRWSAFHKEKRMYRILDKIKKRYDIENKTQIELNNFYTEKELVIYADYREKGSGIIKRLIDKGIKIKLKKLDIGDYLLSSRVCIEYKSVPDFVDSIIDKRLLPQVKELSKYERPLLLIEGNQDIFSQRNIHPNAIMGTIASISIGYGVPILYTKNPDETVLLLCTIAKREQIYDKKDFTLHSLKPHSLKEQQEYIVASIPGVGPHLAKPLLKRFKSIKKIVNAEVNELKEVDLIGDKKAKKIKEVTESNYSE